LPGSKLLTVLLIGLLSAGCGGTASQLVEAPKIDPPQTFTSTGKTWTLKPAMEEDQEALTKFFQIHADYQGSMDFEGPPTMYVAGTKDRRFYWLRGSTQEPAWWCVHFEGGEFSVTDGKGNPFAQ